MSKIFYRKTTHLLFFAAILSALFLPHGHAQASSYSYDTIDVAIVIRTDSTIDVAETQTFDFTGSFHKGWRGIPLKDISYISDISVTDADTGVPLVYSQKPLDKLSSASWGKFTHYVSGGAQNIEWYYDISDAKHAWIIAYKVHGGISFLKSYDRLYWNIFSDYSVPVRQSRVSVRLPQSIDETQGLVASYRSDSSAKIFQYFDGAKFSFTATNFAVGEAFTVDVGWPRGMVSALAFWRDWFLRYFWLILSAAAALGTITFTAVYWYLTERHGRGRGVIVPQYEPPKNLKPAMAEIILKEGITPKAWPATVIDLAVRGYLKIVESKTGFWIFKSTDYLIQKIKPFENDPALEEYEKEFLRILFSRHDDFFSTRELSRGMDSVKRDFAQRMEKLKEKLYEETDGDTKAFEKPLAKEKHKRRVVAAISIVIFIAVQFLPQALGVAESVSGRRGVFLAVALVCGAWIFAYVKYEARLSKEGHLLREDWLGFKMYLEFAGKYRMQNLTPETFEAYLPYAIIFGVEKKWGAAFASVNMQAPSWYVPMGGTNYAIASGGMTGATAPSFSASAFSASFSSSFSSAFSTSTGTSGGGVGGGGAGGGGGGGGGGAS